MLEEGRVLFVTVTVKMGERERREMITSSDVAAQTCKRFCVCLMMVPISGHSCSVADNIFFCCWEMLFFPVSLVCTEVAHMHTFLSDHGCAYAQTIESW